MRYRKIGEKNKDPLVPLKITYRGWPGHFCCGHRCVFHLNTLVEFGNQRLVVSTVGLMLDPMKDGKFTAIGSGRHYETMAFWASYDSHNKCWDADVSKEIHFDSPWCWSKPEDEMLAQRGHELVVKELTDKLVNGQLNDQDAGCD